MKNVFLVVLALVLVAVPAFAAEDLLVDMLAENGIGADASDVQQLDQPLVERIKRVQDVTEENERQCKTTCRVLEAATMLVASGSDLNPAKEKMVQASKIVAENKRLLDEVAMMNDKELIIDNLEKAEKGNQEVEGLLEKADDIREEAESREHPHSVFFP